MLFNTYPFLFVFLPVAVISYRLCARFVGARLSIPWLAALSYVFYSWGEPVYSLLLVSTIAANWIGGELIRKASGRRRRWTLALFLTANLATLAYYKYFNFALAQLHALGFAAGVTHSVVLPIGISFFIFTQIAYLVDLYRNEVEGRNITAYALFVSFFPHLIAGPIIHHKEMIPQFTSPARDHFWRDIYSGSAMLAIGLAKKVLIADTVSAMSSGMFASVRSEPVGFGVAWLGMLAYTAQIYFDFSGYSDMAIGMSQMLGIGLPINFNAPYKSTSIIEFWRRWHITLSRFLRDYLYFSLGGNRRGRRRRYLNLLVTMVLGGLWHGAAWTFVAWGSIHGALLALAHLWSDQRSRFRLPEVPAAIGWGLTFAAVVVAWVPFRAPDLPTAISVWSGMLALHGAGMPDIQGFAFIAKRLGLQRVTVDYGLLEVAQLAAALAIALLAPTSQQILSAFRLGFDSPGYDAVPAPASGPLVLRPSFAFAVLVGLLLAVTVRFIGGYSEFIYFQF